MFGYYWRQLVLFLRQNIWWITRRLEAYSILLSQVCFHLLHRFCALRTFFVSSVHPIFGVTFIFPACSLYRVTLHIPSVTCRSFALPISPCSHTPYDPSLLC